MLWISTLRRSAHTIAIAITLSAGAAACGGGGDSSPVVDGCNRMDECNLLLPGISADECVEGVEVMLESRTPSARADWETLMNGCLQFESCDAFFQCVDNNDL